MEIAIITFYKSSFPFIDELMMELNKKGIKSYVFDMTEMCTVQLIDGKIQIENHTNNFVTQWVSKLKVFGTLYKVIFYKRYFKKINFSPDHVTIHYIIPFYSFFVAFFTRVSKSTSVVVWGSDFLRSSNGKKKMMQPIFNYCDHVLSANVQLANEVGEFYDCKEKIKNVGFGIGKLDYIKSLLKKFDKESLKSELKIPNNKLVITIGYNGISAQQHLLVLESFREISPLLKKKIFILLPFGYGGEVDYKNKVFEVVKSLGIEYNIINDFIPDSHVAKLRICTDLVINAQISDASSASLQEHLYAKNVLLVGDWLKYKHFSDVGIKFWTFNKENLREHLVQILNNFENYLNEVQFNSEIIYEMSSWKMRVNQWINIFNK